MSRYTGFLNREWCKANYLTLIVILFILALIVGGEIWLNYEDCVVGIENALYSKLGATAVMLLLTLLWRSHYMRLLGYGVIVGGFLNAVALAFNGGYMPVSSLLRFEGHHHMPMWETARVKFLCDWIGGAFSIGDVVCCVCFVLLLVSIVRGESKSEETV